MAVETHTHEYARALAENERYRAQFDRSILPLPPGRKLAVLACMDARLTVEDVLALRTGDAHIIRNAGGLATDDALRSLVISQQLLGTEEVIVIEHTGCGMLTFRDEDVRRDLATKTGTDVELPFQPPRAGPANSLAPMDQGRAGARPGLRSRDRRVARGRLIAANGEPSFARRLSTVRVARVHRYEHGTRTKVPVLSLR